jgi:transcriptional regulator with XRE-family HTH domain
MGDYGGEITSSVATSLRDLRRQRGWSLAEVAERAEVHRSTVHLIEQGRRGITLGAAARIARALDVRLSDLVADAEQTSATK